MLRISRHVAIPENELEMSAVRASGAGGQNVNKVATAVHLRFDIAASSLPDGVKQRLLRKRDRRITRDGILVIKARRYRSQEKNREDAIERLRGLIQGATAAPARRKPTRLPAAARRKRLEAKIRRGRLKVLRQKVSD